MLDMFIGTTDTTIATAEWTFTELLRHPRVMQKVQKELEWIVGLGRMVDGSDLERLEYLNLVVKETLRLHPVALLLVPHYSTKDCTIGGYIIPKNSRKIINAFSLGRDPNAWDDPEKFIPERFVGTDVDLKGQHLLLLPFGSGRRSCPGMQLGFIGILPDNMSPEELDMDEEFGLVVSRANHLKVVPTYRLHV